MNFVSVSQFPGTTGEMFYNKFFSKYSLKYSYKAKKCETISEVIAILKDEKINGISVSMPFKSKVIKYLDYLDEAVIKFSTCNTIFLKRGESEGFSTDIFGVNMVLAKIPTNYKISILGDGSISRLFQIRCLELNRDFKVYARNKGNWFMKDESHDCVINCTGFGTFSSESPLLTPVKANLVIDMAIKANQLEQFCIDGKVRYYSGINFYREVFINQFEIYTGISPDPNYFDKLSELIRNHK